jgi:hypothetical protein
MLSGLGGVEPGGAVYHKAGIFVGREQFLDKCGSKWFSADKRQKNCILSSFKN